MSNSQQHVDADNVVASRDRLHAALDALATVLEGHADVAVIAPHTAHASAISSIREDVARLRAKFTEERLLRLGVVGQVKAGKSSLLNLLLFEGKEVLPKAATPMTASLTHIAKSDRNEIEVEYYTTKDWAEIEEHAKEYRRRKEEKAAAQVSPWVQASHELVKMVEIRGLQVNQHLDTTAVESVPVSNMNDKLTSLVGADGNLTPLVKSVSIRCAQGFPDLDIVDTPGINDPISSRSVRAKKMLADCDAVLLLSYAGQLMDNVDVKFFEEELPTEGIRERLIIGSKFDSALIDVARDHHRDFHRASEDTKQRLESHASEAVQRLGKDVAGEDEDVEGTAAQKIIFVSAMCSKLALAPYAQWNDEEKSTFERLREAYPDWIDAVDDSASKISKETSKILTDLGNRQQVVDHLDEVRRNKERIIFSANQQKVKEKRTAAGKVVEQLLHELRTYREKINSVKVEKVDKQMKKLKGLEQRLVVLIGDKWHSCMASEMEPLTTFRSALRAEAKEAREELGGAVSTSTKNKRKKKKGAWNWTKRVFGGETGWETKSYEVRVLNTAAIESAIEEVSVYIADELAELREQLFTDAVFVPKAREALGGILVNELTNDVAEDYDIDMLNASLRDAIATVAANARDKVGKGGNFQPTELSLSSEAVDAGLDQARRAIRSAQDRANRWIERVHEEWSQIAQESEDNLVPLAVAGLKKSQEQLKKDIKDHAFKTGRIDSAMRELEQCQAALRGSTEAPSADAET